MPRARRARALRTWSGASVARAAGHAARRDGRGARGASGTRGGWAREGARRRGTVMAISRRGDKWTVTVYDPSAPGRQRWIGTFDSDVEAADAAGGDAWHRSVRPSTDHSG